MKISLNITPLNATEQASLYSLLKKSSKNLINPINPQKEGQEILYPYSVALFVGQGLHLKKTNKFVDNHALIHFQFSKKYKNKY